MRSFSNSNLMLNTNFSVKVWVSLSYRHFVITVVPFCKKINSKKLNSTSSGKFKDRFPSKHSSWWRRTQGVLKTSWRRLQCNIFLYSKVSSICLQDIIARRLLKDPLKTSLEDVLPTLLEDIYKTSSRRLWRWKTVTLKTSSRRLGKILQLQRFKLLQKSPYKN